MADDVRVVALWRAGLARRELNRWAKRAEAEAEGTLEPRHPARMV